MRGAAYRRLVLAGVAIAAYAAVSAAPSAAAAGDPTPVLAYYYIWFDPTSWTRGKTDYPVLGRYSSDERRVMERHVRWAKAAGIDGFIVSWKGTWRLNRRLEALMDVAAEQSFKLVMIYQGLDFEREPLPVAQIAVDLEYFIRHYAKHKVFRLFAKPVLIWSGTWEFSRKDVAFATTGRRDELLILSTEKDVQGYQRLQGLVDGNAYYWSSANPETYTRLGEKLDAMGQAVHSDLGLWIAPVAPGFDARLIGGRTVVPRRDGETLRKRWDAAIGSSPDAIGVISWNEFSENTHIEPSHLHGTRYLEILADITGATPQSFDVVDSSDVPTAPGTTTREPTGIGYGAPFFGGIVLAFTVIVVTLVWRSRRRALGSELSGGQRQGATGPALPSHKE
jgi:hypothetical protein